MAAKTANIKVNSFSEAGGAAEPPPVLESCFDSDIAAENCLDNENVVDGKIKNNFHEIPLTLRKESKTKRLKLYKAISESGLSCGFICVGIIFFNTQRDSKVEFFCVEHKYFIRRNWETWNRCFNTNNQIYRPSCCHASQTNKALIPEKGADLSFDSVFKNILDTILACSLEQRETLINLVASKKTFKSDNGLHKAPKKADQVQYIQEHAARLNASVVHVEGDQSKSKIILRCNCCQQQNTGTMIKNLGSIQSLRYCVDKNKPQGITVAISEKMERLGHEVIGEPLKVKTDRFLIYCKHHGEKTITTVDQYRQAQNGMVCCALANRTEQSKS